MGLTPGLRLGAYEIVSLIGAGGMGEVYKARDTRLDRDVAIKILPAAFASDADRIARFQREAKTLAALNHPNIAQIFGLEQAGELHALAMELVAGEDLSDRIARGPIPIDEALPIARQIADALEAAHEQGIIHRDLKPANIKVREDGTVKVLDFGLAKAMEPGTVAPNVSQSPTITTPAMMTGVGMILGTAAYMSPEQAKGRPADRRSDVWAFGCVLYEMLTRDRVFGGEDVTDTIAAVVRAEPDWSKLPIDTPTAIRRLLRRCLVKDQKERLADMGTARLEIRDALATPGDEHAARGGPARTFERRRERLAWALFGITIVVATAAASIAYLRRPHADARVYRASLLPTSELTWDPAGRLALSPDGRRIAFLAPDAKGRRVLWVRPLDGLSAQPLAGTDDATYPFWSADSRLLAFVADGKLKKIDASGGPALTLCVVTGSGVAPGTWNRDDVILFTPTTDRRLHRVSAAGGTPSPVTTLDTTAGELTHTFPSFLPDGRHFLYVAYRNNVPLGIYIGSLDSTERIRLFEGGSNVAYAQGFLLFLRETTLMAQRFDVAHLRLGGEALPLAEQIFTQPLRAGAFSVAETGVLAYQSGNFGGQLEWVDRAGTVIGELGVRAPYSDVQLSHDGLHASVTNLGDGDNSDIWTVDVTRNVPARFTIDPGNEANAVWSPDDSRIVFRSNRKGHFDLYQKAADGSSADDVLLADDTDKMPTSWSPDGRWLLYTASNPQTGNDLWILPVDGDRKPTPFLQTPANETQGQFSPDGHWIAYMSTQTGQPEVYVLPFPGPGGQRIVSTAGGQQPRWGHDGKELFYLAPDGKLMAASVTVDASHFAVGTVTPLFDAGTVGGRGRYDVSRDRRFLLNAAYKSNAPQPITLVMNWTAALKP